MESMILVGCDLHDKTMLLKIASNQDAPEKRSFENSAAGRKAMIADLKRRAAEHGNARVALAYEASGLGFGLHDDLREGGIVCHVLAPNNIARSGKHRRSKTDEKDAEHLLEILRGHYLAGNKLPCVWVPSKQTRDDRELLRARLDAHDKSVAVKTQVRTLLKRNGISKPAGTGQGWTVKYRAWLQALVECDEPLGFGARRNLDSLIRQNETLEKEVARFDDDIRLLAQQSRYAANVAKLCTIKGVGVFIAMVFLTEIGSPLRRNARVKRTTVSHLQL